MISMAELKVKLIVNQNLSVFSVNSNINQNNLLYSFYPTFEKRNLQNCYLINNINSNIYSKLKRILPEKEDIFKYQDLLFQIKNFYCNKKTIDVDLTFKNNAVWVLDNIIILPGNIETTYYYDKSLSIKINTINNNDFLQLVFKIPFQNNNYLLNNENTPFKEDLSVNSNKISYNHNSKYIMDINLKDKTLFALKNDNTLTLINTEVYSNNYKYNIKKVSIPNILSYIKNYFSAKINICMKKFQFCKNNLYSNINDFKYVFIQFQCLEKIFNLVIKYLNLKKYDITLFEYCLCDKYLNLTINLNKKKCSQSIINYNTSYIKPIIDKYNIDLPNFNFKSKKIDNNCNNKIHNGKNNKNNNKNIFLNIKNLCKFMGINVRLIKNHRKNTNFNHGKYCNNQLILSIPIIKEVKGKDININTQSVVM